jgi:hypothetical protein
MFVSDVFRNVRRNLESEIRHHGFLGTVASIWSSVYDYRVPKVRDPRPPPFLAATRKHYRKAPPAPDARRREKRPPPRRRPPPPPPEPPPSEFKKYFSEQSNHQHSASSVEPVYRPQPPPPPAPPPPAPPSEFRKQFDIPEEEAEPEFEAISPNFDSRWSGAEARYDDDVDEDEDDEEEESSFESDVSAPAPPTTRRKWVKHVRRKELQRQQEESLWKRLGPQATTGAPAHYHYFRGK